jgi:hypothetical protein
MTCGKVKSRFLTAPADPFAGSEWERKKSACSVRNDGWLLEVTIEEASARSVRNDNGLLKSE